MEQTLRFLLFLSITALVAGCKLAVIVVEDGEVQSIASGTCVAGSICIVDVDDQYFSESFTAVPGTGRYFHKWNSGDRFLCGGSTDPTCTLSFQGHEESEAVEGMVASSETFYLMPVFRRYSDTITVDGKEWAQVDLFTNLSWNQINAVCPKGICAGMLNGHDMTGWIWASVEDLNALFNHYVGRDVLGPGPDHYMVDPNSEWAPGFFNDGWRDMDSGPEDEVGGWVRSLARDFDAYTPSLVNDFTPLDDTFDMIATDPTTGVELKGDSIGGWFYRTP